MTAQKFTLFPLVSKKRQTGSLVIILAFGILLALLGGSVYYNFDLSKKNQELEKNISEDTSNSFKTIPSQDNLPVNNNLTVEKFNPSSTSGSKTYTSPKGFSFEYSGDLILMPETTLPISDLYPNPPVSIGLEGPSVSISITTAATPTGISIRNALGVGPKLSYNGNLINNNNGNFKLFKINGIDAIRADGVSAPTGATAADVILFKDGQIYEIAYYPVNASNEKIFEQIISTFKFVE